MIKKEETGVREQPEKKDTRASRLRLDGNFKNYTFQMDEDGYATAIGAGGSGIVFKGFQEIARSVTVPRALKFFLYRDDIATLPKHQTNGPISVEDFKSEVHNITSFNHQNLVKVIEAGIHSCVEGEVPFIVTEYIDGATLKEIIEGKNKLVCEQMEGLIKNKPELIIDMLIKIGAAVKHIHNRQFSHCDIAPKNIFIQVMGEEIEPILGDLGISKSLDARVATRKSVFIAGSRDWIPENIQGLLNTEVLYKDFVGLQPYWDIFGFCKTGLALLKYYGFANKERWYTALEKALKKGLEEDGYRSIDKVLERLEFIRPIYREVARIPELSNGIGLGKRKMMPIEALKATERLDELIKHPAIFRLSRVPQLTTANHILPGASHTRYEHTLGSLETMRRYLISLLDEKEFLEYFSVEKIELALVCAALSNVTRFPMSNVVHEVRGKNKSELTSLSRKNISEEIFSIKNNKGRTLIDIIEDDFRSLSIENLKTIMSKDKENFDEADDLIFSMLNSSLDVRVVDFVRRDAHHLGVISGNTFHIDELLAHLTVFKNRLALKTTGISVAESIISLRYWLFSRVYWNRPNRAYFSMVRYVLTKLASELNNKEFAKSIITEDQAGVLNLLAKISEDLGMDDCIFIMATLINDSNHLYKITFEAGRRDFDDSKMEKIENASFHDLDEFCELLNKDSKPFFDAWCDAGQRPFLIDYPTEPGSVKLGGDIIVTSGRSKPAPLSDISSIVHGVNESFKSQLSKVRIYRHPNLKIKSGSKHDLEMHIKDRMNSFFI